MTNPSETVILTSGTNRSTNDIEIIVALSGADLEEKENCHAPQAIGGERSMDLCTARAQLTSMTTLALRKVANLLCTFPQCLEVHVCGCTGAVVAHVSLPHRVGASLSVLVQTRPPGISPFQSFILAIHG